MTESQEELRRKFPPRYWAPGVRRFNAPFLITTEQARDFGVTSHQMKTRQAAPVLHGVRSVPGRFEELQVPDWADARWEELHTRARAFQLLHPRSVAGGLSAAFLYGYPLPLSADLDNLHVTVPGSAERHRITGVTSSRSKLFWPVERYGIRLNAGPYMLMELVDELAEDELIMVIEAVVGGWRGPPELSVADLRERIVSAPHDRRTSRLLTTVDRARDGVRSPKETEYRLACVAAGLPEPIPNFLVRIASGRVREVDLAFEDYRVGFEYHGRDHFNDRAARTLDANRADDLRNVGWHMIDGYGGTPVSDYLARIERALRQRGWPGPPHLPGSVVSQK
ncbi:hypothetical protein NQ038_04400 [Brevibacterium sp. 50QC2O2]|jgi:hypothetical protein|uniref:hypothetical protein n=1 Tax=Brevibacterium TaxID=1696 RepID=UPI00211C8734|nr:MULTISPECIES: hypothetical protein [unclassified Brevibacterium]MCQ9384555.1 hypothetical protein [Brevibacterium sp. 68QC2CO]MCQ9387885.1 hypothetical protein [Brevibacterium sp. 50QC2O2]